MKSEVKHVSFDFWNTLVKPNPKYAELRTEYLANAFGVSEAFAKAVYSSIKHRIDADTLRQSTNRMSSVEECLHLLFFTFPNTFKPKKFYDDQLDDFSFTSSRNDKLTLRFISEARSTFANLFASAPPIIDYELLADIAKLKKLGISTSITSITNFISGVDILKFLERNLLGVNADNAMAAAGISLSASKRIGLFDFSLFSDLETAAKPSKQAFDQVFDLAKILHKQEFERANICHIGDDKVADFDGASNAGFQAIQVSKQGHNDGSLPTTRAAVQSIISNFSK